MNVNGEITIEIVTRDDNGLPQILKVGTRGKVTDGSRKGRVKFKVNEMTVEVPSGVVIEI